MLRYGLRFISASNFNNWISIMNDSGLFRMPEGLPEEVVELLNHLQATGTGIQKLRDLAEIAKRSKSEQEFLAASKVRMNEVTWAKIEKYVKGVIANRPVKPLGDVLGAPKQGEGSKAHLADKTLGNAATGLKSDTANDGTDPLISPVKNMTPKDAITKIDSGAFSKEQLETIVLSEERTTVAKAAQKKYDEVCKREGSPS